jgi:hypothetical protein
MILWSAVASSGRLESRVLWCCSVEGWESGVKKALKVDLRSVRGAEMVVVGEREGSVGVRAEERIVWRGRFGVVGGSFAVAGEERLDICYDAYEGIVASILVGC